MALRRVCGRGRLLGQVYTVNVTRIATHYKARVNQESFLNGTSSSYVSDMYNLWLKDPKSVHTSWNSYFIRVTRGAEPGQAYMSPPTITPAAPYTSPYQQRHQALADKRRLPTALSVGTPSGGGITEKLLEDHLAMQNIIRAYQNRGHLVADVDPLGLAYGELYSSFEDRKGQPPKRVVRDYMLNSADAMDTVFKLPRTTFIGGPDKALSLRVILQRLEKIYCHHIGVEYTYITSQAKNTWLAQKFETPGIMEISIAEKRLIMKRLVRTTCFEAFLAKKYVSEKRFGIEGCEILIPALKKMIDHASMLGARKILIGMPHRGRLNVIVNVLRQPLYKLFTHFSGLDSEDSTHGDVKYHLGLQVTRTNRATNKPISVMVVANPSHLEAVDPVLMGKVRAEQFFEGDTNGKAVLGILMHGDAAFCGQGVVFESIHLSNLPEYTPRGIIHIVVNNQIGFTTDPRYSRSSPYCTDVARVTKAPIFHVNGDDPEAVIYVCMVAIEYRNLFQRDVVVDIVCYRRNGHNEIDEPSFTQPLMYKKIRAMPYLMDKYAKTLIAQGVITAAEINEEKATYEKICEDEFERAKSETHIKWRDWIDTPWKGFFKNKNPYERRTTGVDKETLKYIGTKFASPPPKELNIQHHKGLDRIFKSREEMVKKEQADWALGEALAFGSLMKEGVHVRLSGQDVERGTFSHRHHVIHDQNVDKKFYVPLKHLYPGKQAEYSLCNSSISELGVLGFEIGFSTTNPNALVIWEAQFGDFNNGSQVMIDQFLCSGEAKWIRQSGLVMLNPHGMEGMGPEHSSARIERFLIMSHDDPDTMPDVKDPNFYMRQLRDINWIVANCSTPANFFHVVRRQIAMPFRKPLILFTPKSLLRHPRCRGHFEDMKEGTEFQRIIPDNGPASKNPQGVKKHIFCSGKVYYDILEARENAKLDEVIAISRLEQLCPFPYDILKPEVDKYPNSELCWAQEEHKNMGAWYYIIPRFSTALQECDKDAMTYIGRVTSSSPATGSKAIFKAETDELLSQAMRITDRPPKAIAPSPTHQP